MERQPDYYNFEIISEKTFAMKGSKDKEVDDFLLHPVYLRLQVKVKVSNTLKRETSGLFSE